MVYNFHNLASYFTHWYFCSSSIAFPNWIFFSSFWYPSLRGAGTPTLWRGGPQVKGVNLRWGGGPSGEVSQPQVRKGVCLDSNSGQAGERLFFLTWIFQHWEHHGWNVLLLLDTKRATTIWNKIKVEKRGENGLYLMVETWESIETKTLYGILLDIESVFNNLPGNLLIIWTCFLIIDFETDKRNVLKAGPSIKQMKPTCRMNLVEFGVTTWLTLYPKK